MHVRIQYIPREMVRVWSWIEGDWNQKACPNINSILLQSLLPTNLLRKFRTVRYLGIIQTPSLCGVQRSKCTCDSGPLTAEGLEGWASKLANKLTSSFTWTWEPPCVGVAWVGGAEGASVKDAKGSRS